MSEEIKKNISCLDDYDPESISKEHAIEDICQSIKAIDITEAVSIKESLGRVLAEDIISNINVPTNINSAMDGYAINSHDLPKSGIKKLKIIGTCFAGNPFKDKVKRDECVRIMTGAIMPEGTDTVVIQEQVSIKGDMVLIDNITKPHSNVRNAGEDMAIGDLVLQKGLRISPADMGVLASLGLTNVDVYKKIKVAFFSTGDELCQVGVKLKEGCIYDSNRYTLYGMLSKLGVDIVDMGVVRDEKHVLEKAFIDASNKADVLITSGGVSVGDADYVKEVLNKHGTMNFCKVAIKPGRPLTFGKINNTWFFGLPGNPVSVMLTFYQFVQNGLKQLMGEKIKPPFILKVKCVDNLKKRPGRVEYQRGILEKAEDGEMIVRKTGKQGSGILRSMAYANCFIILPIERKSVKAGDIVNVQLFYDVV